MRGISINPDQYASQNLANAPLVYDASYNHRFKLDEVLIGFSQGVYETVTVTLISKNGSNYNVVLDSQTLGGESSYRFVPTGENNFQTADKIEVKCTNANGIGTAYMTIKSSMLGSGA